MSSPLSDSRKARRYSEAFDEEDEQLSRLFEASASRERQYSIVSVLDQGKLSTNSKGVFGDTALHFAAHAGNAPGVHLLLQRGADVNARNNLQVTPLGKAALAGHLDAMRVLIAAGADIEALDDISGTPLMCAAKRNQSEAVALLLRRGASPNATDASANTALHLAAAEGHISAIAALLQGGANPTVLNNRKQSPLDVAMRSWGDALLKDKMGRMLTAASPTHSPTATAATAAAADTVSMEQIAV